MCISADLEFGSGICGQSMLFLYKPNRVLVLERESHSLPLGWRELALLAEYSSMQGCLPLGMDAIQSSSPLHR